MNRESSPTRARSVSKAIHTVVLWPLLVASMVMAFSAFRYLAEASTFELGTISTISRDPLLSAAFSLLLGPILLLFAWRSTVRLPRADDIASRRPRKAIRAAAVAYILANLAVLAWFGVLWIQSPGRLESISDQFAALSVPRLILRAAWTVLLVAGLSYLGRIYRLSGRDTRSTISYISAGSLLLSLLCFLFTSLVDVEQLRSLSSVLGEVAHRLSDADGLAFLVTAYLMMASDSSIKLLSTIDVDTSMQSQGHSGFRIAGHVPDGQAPISGS